MRVAGRLSTISGRWSKKEENRQNELLSKFGIPKTLKECGIKFSFDAAWQAMGADKKTEKHTRFYILPIKIGKVEKTSEPTKKQVFEAFGCIY